MPARFALLAVLVAAAPAVAAPPSARDELLALVPADTAVCFVVTGLRDRAKAVSESPFAGWVGKRFEPLLAGSEADKLRAVEGILPTLLGVTLADLRDDIFGDAVVLAYQPGPPGKPDADRGVVMLKARDAAKLSKLIDRLNAAQKDAGEVRELVAVDHAGGGYTKRVKADGGAEFYHLSGGLFAFAAQEDALKAVLDRRAGTGSAAPVAADLTKLGVGDAFLACWVNPRRFDADLAAKLLTEPTDRDKAALGQFIKTWAAIDTLAVYLHAGKAIEVGFAASYRADALPAELQPLLATPPVRSPLWDAVPADAMIAAAGRVDVPALLDGLLSFAPPAERDADRKQIDRDIGAVFGKLWPAVPKSLGPDWVAWAAPPADGWFPRVTAAVRVRDDIDPGVPAAVGRAVGFFVQSAQVEHNRTHESQLELTESDGLKVLSGDAFPPGVRPAVGVVGGYLIAGSSPAAVRAFAVRPAAAGAAEVPLVRVSAAAVRGYLRTHSGPLAKWLAGVQDRAAADVEKDVRNLADVLEAFDRLEVVARGDGKTLRVGVRLSFVEPLAK